MGSNSQIPAAGLAPTCVNDAWQFYYIPTDHQAIDVSGKSTSQSSTYDYRFTSPKAIDRNYETFSHTSTGKCFHIIFHTSGKIHRTRECFKTVFQGILSAGDSVPQWEIGSFRFRDGRHTHIFFPREDETT